jgi:hypothetical protein
MQPIDTRGRRARGGPTVHTDHVAGCRHAERLLVALELPVRKVHRVEMHSLGALHLYETAGGDARHAFVAINHDGRPHLCGEGDGWPVAI